VPRTGPRFFSACSSGQPIPQSKQRPHCHGPFHGPQSSARLSPAALRRCRPQAVAGQPGRPPCSVLPLADDAPHAQTCSELVCSGVCSCCNESAALRSLLKESSEMPLSQMTRLRPGLGLEVRVHRLATGKATDERQSMKMTLCVLERGQHRPWRWIGPEVSVHQWMDGHYRLPKESAPRRRRTLPTAFSTFEKVPPVEASAIILTSVTP